MTGILPFTLLLRGPKREFCIALFSFSKNKATVENIGDMMWNNTVGPNAVQVATKQSPMHAVPPSSDEASLYCLVLDHGDFGIHNMSMAMDANCLISPLWDCEAWRTGYPIPSWKSVWRSENAVPY